ncbi:hypothetical protein ABTC37_19715, partial [Acinetobacter baumannii]
TKEDSQTVEAIVGIMMNPGSPVNINGTPPMEIETVFAFQVINSDTQRLSIDPSATQEPIISSEADSFVDIKQINDEVISTARTKVYDALIAL